MASPFKSIAQRNRCQQLVAEGKMTQEQFDEADRLTDLASLPERLHPKKEPKAAEPNQGDPTSATQEGGAP